MSGGWAGSWRAGLRLHLFGASLGMQEGGSRWSVHRN